MSDARHRSSTGRDVDSQWVSKLQRWLLAISAAVCMIVGLGILWWSGGDEASSEFFANTLFKVGVVCGLAWLAAPQLERFGWHRLRGTLLVAIVIVMVLWAGRPRIGAIAGAVIIGVSIFFSLLGWLRAAVFDPPDKGDFSPKTRKIEKNPTRS